MYSLKIKSHVIEILLPFEIKRNICKPAEINLHQNFNMEDCYLFSQIWKTMIYVLKKQRWCLNITQSTSSVPSTVILSGFNPVIFIQEDPPPPLFISFSPLCFLLIPIYCSATLPIQLFDCHRHWTHSAIPKLVLIQYYSHLPKSVQLQEYF